MRRRAFAGLLAGAAVAATPLIEACSSQASAGPAGAVGASSTPDACYPGARRYVIGTGADGKSFTQSSGCVATGQKLGSDGSAGTLWTTNKMPVDNAAPVTATGYGTGGTGPFHSVDPDGTVFSFMNFAHGDGLPANMPAGSGGGGSHPGIHKTSSLDYWVILEGEVTLFTDTDEILLRAGDTLVVRGADHTWYRKSDKPCRAVTVSVYANPLPA